MQTINNIYQIGSRNINLAQFFEKPISFSKCFCFILGACLWYVITTGAYHDSGSGFERHVCLYGGSSTTCSFGSALGFFAFVGSAVAIYIDLRLPNESSMPTKRRIMKIDIYIAVSFACIHLLAFIMFWSKVGNSVPDEANLSYAKIGIMISLFASIAWGITSLLAYRRFEEFNLEIKINELESDGKQKPDESSVANGVDPAQAASPQAVPFTDGYGY
ncbi:unnamed protein product [Auanema sp. JU1783]|nr:unnamed protein product [Auanema sp. JU1783]